MPDTGVQYTVTIAKTGEGAVQAAAELKALQSQAAATNVALGAGGAQLAVLNTSTKSATVSLKAFQHTAQLVGFQTFPQLTLAAITAREAIKGVQMAAVASGLSVAATTGTFAVLAVSILSTTWAIKEFMSMMEATEKLEKSMSAATSQAADSANQLKKALREATAEGLNTLDPLVMERVQKMLARPTLQNLDIVRKQMREGIPAGFFQSQADRDRQAGEQTADFERMQRLVQASLEYNQALSGFTISAAGREQNINRLYQERLALYRQLHETGLYTEKQLQMAADEATIKRLAGLTALKRELTSVQKLGQQAAEVFASQLSASIVQAFTEGGEAMRRFASEFFATLAQMMLQLAIMRILFGSSGQSTGTGGLIGGLINKAALGGHFALGGARLMAGGGLAEVTQATYLPRFNVIAGEAGREMLTVLARPRMMEIGGMEAVVGNAGAERLAITRAEDLARGGAGAGGQIHLHVSLEPGLRAEIVSQSVEGAVVRVTQDAQRHTRLREAIKTVSS